MARFPSVHSFEVIKVLSDPRRLEILRRLMAAPATLTQLGRRMGKTPAWIRHHLLALQKAGLVQFDHVGVVGRATEKYYRARAGAFLIEQVILPSSRGRALVFAGSDDPALQEVATHLRGSRRMVVLSVGSLDGLMNLRRGLCEFTGIHLLDDSGEYNIPYVRHFFADRTVELITLAHRTQGLMLSPGNPHSIRGVEDLLRPGIELVNRNPGSGTRLWLDRALERLGAAPQSLRGYFNQVDTHRGAAALVMNGKADAALGLQAAAHEKGLDFIPLFEERYDLVLAPSLEKRLAPMLDFVQTEAFRTRAAALAGYNTAHSGELIPI